MLKYDNLNSNKKNISTRPVVPDRIWIANLKSISLDFELWTLDFFSEDKP
jgi:hypothetical protein